MCVRNVCVCVRNVCVCLLYFTNYQDAILLLRKTLAQLLCVCVSPFYVYQVV